LKNNPKEYSDINGTFNFDNNDVKVTDLSFRRGKNDFLISGFLHNIIPHFMISNQKYSVEGKVNCKNIDLDELLAGDPDSKENWQISLPEDLELNSEISIADLSFKGFRGKNIHGSFDYRNHCLTINNVSLQAISGTAEGSGTISQLAGGALHVHTTAKLNHMDIKEMFTVFNNFGQTFIREKHLKGFLTADVNLSSEWSPQLECNLKKLVVISNVTINNGELNDFKPMEELARFIDLNELKNIRFSDLKNDILIKDEKIIIPQMDINSSALNVTLSGEQTFDYKINYKLKILLSDVLFKKAKKNKKENDEFGVIEDDGLGKTCLYLLITGTTDDFKIKYDTKQVKENIKEAVKEEKKNLKTILNEEFGLFKNDTAVAANKKKKEEEEKARKKKKVRVKWDENSEGEKDRSEEK
jgi:hypothetical protein